ncbi:aldo/keto reductase [Virgibacillus salexigens]|uniref:aldo/keto reductase n=1 Tax=Virgibacillus massiliensis TaxID=1462526 RepID=UPI00136ABDA4|nr:aldo/keto reductase [Virgibacillus massiliensis]MYL40373.1 aldo/keto reductase [Virgibacillus massiliensis]
MMKHLQDTITLNNNVKMPGFGLGVYKVEDGSTVKDAVKNAIIHGYRSIDTASFYDNETGVGEAIQESGIPREELFITTKVWNDQQGYGNTRKAFHHSMERLGLKFLDLYLIHWPVKGLYKDTWMAMEKLYKEGKIRAIGVSNFHQHHLENLMDGCMIKPAVNQVEYHPHLTQQALHAFCKKHDIQLEAWSPLKRGGLVDEPVLKQIGEKYNKTAAQVILRWDIQNEVITIPKSTKEHRIIENASIFDFTLTKEEMKQITNLNINERSGSNPDRFD